VTSAPDGLPVAPSRMTRVGIALVAAVVATAYFLARNRFSPTSLADFDQAWGGAKALLRGQSPYLAVGPHGTVLVWPYPLFYPIFTSLAALPVAPLPLPLARIVFVGGSAGWLGYALSGRGFARLPLFASAPFLTAVMCAQWSPLLVAAALTPGCVALYMVKPNEGLALAAGLTTRRATRVGALVAALCVAASVLLWPTWIVEWLQALQRAEHFGAPLQRPGGLLVLVALLRWRRAEARMLVALLCIPQTMLLYSVLGLFLVPATLIEMTLLAILSWGAFAVQMEHSTSFPVLTAHTGTAMVWCLYLPCAVMVLRRPNVWTALAEPGRVEPT
jgi:hypothetical protein